MEELLSIEKFIELEKIYQNNKLFSNLSTETQDRIIAQLKIYWLEKDPETYVKNLLNSLEAEEVK